MAAIYIPIFSIIIIYLLFTRLLKTQVRKNLFCELGFLYLTLVVLYSVLPGFVFIYGSMVPGDPISVFLDMISINTDDLVIHFWRHWLFIFSFSIGYLAIRGRAPIKFNKVQVSSHLSILSVIVILVICLLLLSLMSATVDSYHDNYVRYDHLPVPLRKMASIIYRFKSGFYTILIALMFLDHKRYKILIVIVVIAICVYELIYSHGSRIIVLIILLQTFFLYNYIVRIFPLKKLAIYIFILLFFFSSIEVIRLMDSDMQGAKDVVLEDGIKSPGELGAVFISSFHLYSERQKSALPPVEWQMFFYDFISPFTFNSFNKWNPMFWYADYYFPDSKVPPFTLGPIADSAIWGGEVDLFFRAFINGVFFAMIVRWFQRYGSAWWAVAIYSYFFSNAVITLKYSVFFYLTPLVKDLLPTIIIIATLRQIYVDKKRSFEPMKIPQN